jgi:hypothetical protein
VGVHGQLLVRSNVEQPARGVVRPRRERVPVRKELKRTIL